MERATVAKLIKHCYPVWGHLTEYLLNFLTKFLKIVRYKSHKSVFLKLSYNIVKIVLLKSVS